jgi:hypothetical protein
MPILELPTLTSGQLERTPRFAVDAVLCVTICLSGCGAQAPDDNGVPDAPPLIAAAETGDLVTLNRLLVATDTPIPACAISKDYLQPIGRSGNIITESPRY